MKSKSKPIKKKQQAQFFTEENFLPMIRAVLNPKRSDIGFVLRKELKKRKNQRFFVRNKRVFSLCKKLIETAAKSGFALVPSDIANLFLVGASYKEEINVVTKIGAFIS